MAIKCNEIQNELLDGVIALTNNCNAEITINAKQGAYLEVILENGTANIIYRTKAEFFRGLGYVLSAKDNIRVRETARFTMLGAMLDMSRNAVMKVSKVKQYLNYMALMGFNCLMLYNEDVYELENHPFFGYMRGRYTQAELKEIDDHADMLGIEVIPCIQTLGHLEQYLKWNEGNLVKDTASVLLAENEETYHFIDEMITAAVRPFRSKRIHIGMDEAHDVGLGRYLSKNGFKNRFDILIQHLNQVTEITNSKGLKPMMWGDMFFRLASPRHAYYDLETKMPQDIKDRLPNGMEIIYWDYYNNDVEFYKSFIDTHLEMTDNTIFAGGVWTWRGIMPDYHTTIATTQPALEACISKGIKEVVATLWGDDGAENSYITGLAGLQMYAEYCYNNSPTDKEIAKRFAQCTGGDFELMLDMSLFHHSDGVSHRDIVESIKKLPMNDILRGRHQVGRKYMWQDILCGVFDNQIIKNPVSDVYSRILDKIQTYTPSEMWEPYQKLAESTFDFMVDKTYIAEKLILAYQTKDLEELKAIVKKLTMMKPKLEQLRTLHRVVWFEENKPFGWETLDIRYGGVLMRIDTAIERLTLFLDNPTIILEELEQERLPYDRVAADWQYKSFATCGIL